MSRKHLTIIAENAVFCLFDFTQSNGIKLAITINFETTCFEKYLYNRRNTMKNKLILTLAGISALAVAGCDNTATNSNTNVNRALNANNSNVAVVVPSNTNATTANTYTVSTTNSWNGNITREEYEKDKANYANRAKEAGSTVGQGANDAWLWTKTKAALATTTDLRDSTINVDVTNDVVTLKGTVASAAEKTKAESVAKGIDGVKSVKNDLQVKANDSMTNQMVNGTANTKSNTNANAAKK